MCINYVTLQWGAMVQWPYVFWVFEAEHTTCKTLLM
jgi:hypothetical protein